MSEELVRYEIRGTAAWITLDSPSNRNALSPAVVAQLGQALDRAMVDAAVRAVVLTGEGPAFCAGADLKARPRAADPKPRGGDFVDVLKQIRHGPKPVLAAVNGHAFGGGLGLVAAADIAVAAEGARFSFSEVRVGVIPAIISVVVLPKLGEHQAMRLFLTGERFGVEAACRYGLLHRAVPAAELQPAVDEELAMLVRGGPIALREAKRLIREVARLPEDEAFSYARGKIGELFASPEAAEGMASFAEKRPPKWVKEGSGL